MKKILAAIALALLMAGCTTTGQQAASSKPCPCCESMKGMDHSKMDHSKMECCKDGFCPHHPEGHEGMNH